ncbi:hypothetical protein ACHAXN_005199 [Cyclotella atomus]
MLSKLAAKTARRPLTALSATTTLAAASYAAYTEHNASLIPLESIPRSHYDPSAIQSYWSARPLSAASRVAHIACEIGPVAFDYLCRFQLLPRLGLVDAASNSEVEARELAIKLRGALTELGPTFIKVGQQLSIRPDLVSPTVLYELQRLCDAVPPFECGVAMRVLAEELRLRASGAADTVRGGNGNINDSNDNSLSQEEIDSTILSVFQEMPRLVASASLGQVYKAKLLKSHPSNSNKINEAITSDEVAIKIQRPDIYEQVTLDLYLLQTYGKTVDRLCSIFTHQIPYHEKFINGFANGAYMELNYENEAWNQVYFRRELGRRFNSSNNSSASGNDYDTAYNDNNTSFLNWFRAWDTSRQGDRVIVPKVYTQFTTERILVTEWIHGKPLAQSSKEQIRQLIPVGVELFLCQLLDIGKFHADPHPGNLYVTIKEGKPTLALLDFGLIANVDSSARTAMTNAIINLLQGDYDTLIAHDAKHLGFLPPDMDVTELKPILKTILKAGLVDSGSNLHDRRRNLMAISKELNQVFFEYPFSVPPFFALVTRGLGLLEGIALSGDPSFDIFKASYPYAKKRAVETLSVRDYGKISRNLMSLRLFESQAN